MQIERFLSRAHYRDYPKGTVLQCAELPINTIGYLLSGTLMEIIPPIGESRDLVCDLLGPGNFYGEVGCFNPAEKSLVEIRTKTACRVAVMSCEAFEQHFADDSALFRDIACCLTARLRETTHRLQCRHMLSLKEQIWRLLNTLSRQSLGKPHPDGYALKISRIELARMAGCTRESAGKVLRDLSRQRYIALEGSTLVILGEFLSAEISTHGAMTHGAMLTVKG